MALASRGTCPVIMQRKETIETKMSPFASSLTVPDSACLCHSVIITDSDNYRGLEREKLGEKNKGINHCFTSSAWPHGFVESLTRREACMPRPQRPPLPTEGSTLRFCFCSLSFPTYPPPPSHLTPQHRKSHGSLYTGNSTQKFG